MKQGRVISNPANLYKVEIEDTIYTCVARGKIKQENPVVVGDIVQVDSLQEEKKEAVIEEIVPRTNFVKRPKIANITQLIFVVSMKMPKSDTWLLDKQLVYAEWLGIQPLICLNKIDLVEETQVKELQDLYTSIGYTVIPTIANQKEGIQTLQQHLQGHITALAGNSGVGKSTLMNALLQQNVTIEGSISSKNKKGKNTTTQVQLYTLGNHSYLADTPGFSSFSIEEIDAVSLANYFREFRPYISRCAYVGCSHIKEEDCGIRQAVKEGLIAKSRYENYCQLYRESKQREETQWQK